VTFVTFVPKAAGARFRIKRWENDCRRIRPGVDDVSSVFDKKPKIEDLFQAGKSTFSKLGGGDLGLVSSVKKPFFANLHQGAHEHGDRYIATRQ
jgi:hypothetical protein